MERPVDRSAVRHPSSAPAIWIALVAMLLTGLSGISDGPRPAAPTVVKLKVAPGARSDVRVPRFSNPTAITNPLLPVSRLSQVIQLGADGGDRLRFETTLLPGTRAVQWDGQAVPTVMSQLVAYSNGRVAEVATDFYAQSDDGAVWHFGEEAANYDDGVLIDREGSWLAGRDGRPGMVMPARPQVGDVFRPGSAPGQTAEEVTVRSTDKAVEGPQGRVDGALQVQENLGGTVEDKTFAPGYGELNARIPADDELYNVALAVPTDAVAGGLPEALVTVTGGAERILGQQASAPGPPLRATAADWAEIAASVEDVTEAWARYAHRQSPAMLVAQMSGRLADLVAAVGARRPARVHQAAIAVAQAGLDLQLRHRPPADVDRDRLRLWARQLVVDAAADDAGAVTGDVVVLEALWARRGPPEPGRVGVDPLLADLRAAAEAGDLPRAAGLARSLAAP